MKDKNDKDSTFYSIVHNKIVDDEDVGSGSKRLHTLGDIFILFLSQSISSMINDIITAMGLDGRIDVLILLVSISVVFFHVYAYVQKYILQLNKKSKMAIMTSAVNPKSTAKNAARRQMEFKQLSILSESFILYKNQFVWRRFLVSMVEFVAMVSGILMTYYSQKCLSLFLNNLNVSVYTLIIPVVVVFVYMIALKTTFLPSSADGEYEKILTSEDLHDYMEKQLI